MKKCLGPVSCNNQHFKIRTEFVMAFFHTVFQKMSYLQKIYQVKMFGLEALKVLHFSKNIYCCHGQEDDGEKKIEL